MNIVIANKYKDLLNNLDIEIIKSLDGVYDTSQIANEFKNFYFDKMILDITAIKDYSNIYNLKKLTTDLDMNRIIFFLDNNELCSSQSFLSSLVSLGIYNFTRNIEGIKHLLHTPNTLENVFSILNSSSKPNDNELSKQVEVPNISNLNQNTLYTDISFQEEPKEVVGNLYDSNDFDNSFEPYENYENFSSDRRVIGIKNLTDHAGATSLIYMMINELKRKYKVMAIEVNKLDFTIFKDKTYISASKLDLEKTIQRYATADVIFVDLNNYPDVKVCDEVLYLVEPSKLKLKRLVLKDKETFKKIRGEKIILNQSLLNKSEITEFEYETRSKVYYNIPPVNDRIEYNEEIIKFLRKLNFKL